MIRVVFEEQGDATLIKVSMRGHANFGDGPLDLLCAGVSGMVTALANTLTDATDFGDHVFVRLDPGDAEIQIDAKTSLDAVQRTVAQTLMRGFRLNMEALQKQYPDYIEVEIRRIP